LLPSGPCPDNLGVIAGLLKMNVDVVSVCAGANVLEPRVFAIGLQLVSGGEGLLRQGLRGRGVEIASPKTGRSCGSDMRFLVFCGQDRGTAA